MLAAPTMTRAVLDSSVLVSAFLKPDSVPAMLLARAREGAFLLCLSSYIVEETASVLSRPRSRLGWSFRPEEIARFCHGLMAVAEIAGELPEIDAVPDDPKDNPIVATAIVARAHYLVTGDRAHLLPLGTYEGIRIVSPRAFLETLEGA